MAKAGKIIIQVLNIVLIILFVILIAFNVLNVVNDYLSSRGRAVKIFGLSHQIINSDTGKLTSGDYAIFKKQKIYSVGKIIKYQDDNNFFVKEITAYSSQNYFVNDVEVTPSQVVGEYVFSIPKLGIILTYLRTPLGMLLLVLGGALIFASPKLISLIINPKKKNSYSTY